jgi:hypothetical protein
MQLKAAISIQHSAVSKDAQALKGLDRGFKLNADC